MESSKSFTDKMTALEKTQTEKINQCQKTLAEKMTAQEKGVKEVSEKMGEKVLSWARADLLSLPDKLEKCESGSKADTSSSAKLVTLTKAIDSIQENSKSLETMGKESQTCLYYVSVFQ